MRLDAVAVGVLILGLLLVPSAARAHPVTDHYQEKWAQPWNVPWGFTEGFPDGAKRDRVADGFRVWNENEQPLQWVQNPADFPDFDPMVCPQPARRNGVHGRNFSGAFARVCFDPAGNLLSTQIVIGSTRDWWTELGPVPSSHYDLWSAVSQEVGHATGFLHGGSTDRPGHWPEENATLCPDPYTDNYLQRHTMCEFLFAGTRVQRVPYTHDDHTFNGAYDDPVHVTTTNVPPIEIG